MGTNKHLILSCHCRVVPGTEHIRQDTTRQEQEIIWSLGGDKQAFNPVVSLSRRTGHWIDNTRRDKVREDKKTLLISLREIKCLPLVKGQRSKTKGQVKVHTHPSIHPTLQLSSLQTNYFTPPTHSARHTDINNNNKNTQSKKQTTTTTTTNK